MTVQVTIKHQGGPKKIKVLEVNIEGRDEDGHFSDIANRTILDVGQEYTTYVWSTRDLRILEEDQPE